MKLWLTGGLFMLILGGIYVVWAVTYYYPADTYSDTTSDTSDTSNTSDTSDTDTTDSTVDSPDDEPTQSYDECVDYIISTLRDYEDAAGEHISDDARTVIAEEDCK